MRLEKYISDLLYRYDLVIIPEFGGIVGRKNPAKIDRSTHTFSPPYKDLTFNVNLKNNDGLLVNYIATKKQISHRQALAYILQCVAGWKKELQETRRLRLADLGFFNLLDQERILFSAFNTVNYLKEAYGLHTFTYTPVVAELPIGTIEDKLPEKKPVSDYSFRKNLMKYAAVFLVGAGLFAGMKFLYPKIAQQPLETETYQKATFIFNEAFPTIKISYKSDKKKTVQSFSDYPYQIIVGAFRIEANAKRKVRQLKQSGFDAEIVGKNKYALHMVSCQGFSTKSEAIKALRKIRREQNSAWIYKKH